MPGEMSLCIWDVEHGACATLMHRFNGTFGRLAMIDSGDASDWRPSDFITKTLRRNTLNYLFVTNADQDHLSDLDGLSRSGVSIETLSRNPYPSEPELRKIKEAGGELTADIERFLGLHATYNAPIGAPFNDNMGGIRFRSYYNSYPTFSDTNNLSCVFFFEYGRFKIIFPGDLERDGWLALLERDDFRAELGGVTIFVASHHGRENGYCKEVFDYCRPMAVVMSDKAVVHDTQKMASTYHDRVAANFPDGVMVETTGKRRHVLTTRRDGHIDILVDDTKFWINTEYQG